MAAADCGNGRHIRACAVIVWACDENGIRPAAGKRRFDGLRRDHAAERRAFCRGWVNEIAVMPGERHARDGGFMAVPREKDAFVFADGKEHRKDAGRGTAHEQEAVPCTIGLGVGLLRSENRTFRRVQIVRAGDLRHIPGGERRA